MEDLGIKIIGEILAILKCVELLNKDAKPQTEPPSKAIGTEGNQAQAKCHKPTNLELPNLKGDSTHPEFRNFKMDWAIYKKLATLPENLIAVQLYSACDNSIQNSILNLSEDFLTLQEDEIFSLLSQIAIKEIQPSSP